MNFEIIDLLFSSPRFKKIIHNKEKSIQIKQQINKAEFIVRLALIISGFTYMFFGKTTLKIPILKKSVSMLIALIKMHSLNDFITPVNNKFPECVLNESEYDEIIIGSGPGGSIAAYESIKSGKKSLLVERGSYIDKSVAHHGVEQLTKYFLHGGQNLVIGKKLIPFAQGSVVGGGSEINSGLYHRIPDFVKSEWFRNFKWDPVLWDKSEIEIEKFLSIQKQKVSFLGCYSKSPIIEIGKNNGWEYQQIPRWRKYNGKEFEHYGMESSYLSRALESGLEIIPGHFVQKIEIMQDYIISYVFGDSCKHKLKSRYLTISAGTTETPKLLLDSGLASIHDFSFNFHAMTRVIGIFNRQVNDLEDIDPFQTWNSDFSIKIGAAVGTPSMLLATLASLEINKVDFDLHNIFVAYVSTIPKGTGGFNKIFGTAYPYFNFTKQSITEIRKNTEMLFTSLQRAGASDVLAKIDRPSISSVHIFGSLPLGNCDLIDNRGFLNGGKDMIRICDASLLPSAPRVNPQGPIMALTSVLSKEVHNKYWI